AVLCPPVQGARVVSARTLAGTAGTTTRRTLHLVYNQAGAVAALPQRLFVKSTSSIAQRVMLGLGGLIQGEPRFYGTVRPRLEIEAPASYFGAVDQRSWRSVLLLEDVVYSRGASFWDPETRITRAQIEDLLRMTAGWHGRLWDSPLLSSWTWLRSPGDQLRVIDGLLGLADRTPAGTERARAVLPPSLASRRHDLHEAMRRSLTAASQGPMTYLHGDLHVANTYLAADGSVGVCDWQCGLRGSWVHDFAYIVATALETEDRRAWEWELLQFYLEHLAAAGGGTLSPEAAWLAYRGALFYPYFAWIYTLGRSRIQPAFQPDGVSLTLIGRIAAAIDDLGGLAAVGL
ncbi:MAG: phosphotransferase, partial [Streptosporangiaceae bacterium]